MRDHTHPSCGTHTCVSDDPGTVCARNGWRSQCVQFVVPVKDIMPMTEDEIADTKKEDQDLVCSMG